MFKLFVRWNREGEGYDVVELIRDGRVVQTSTTFCNNRDRVYGYCQGVVDALTTVGIQIEMPRCLTGRHLCADTSRED